MIALAIPVFVVLLLWVAHHAINIDKLADGRGGQFTALWIVVFASLLWHVTLAWTERPYKVDSARQQAVLDALSVTVDVPAYNEDPATLRLVLVALLQQTRMPQEIAVVDDGWSVDVRDWFLVPA